MVRDEDALSSNHRETIRPEVLIKGSCSHLIHQFVLTEAFLFLVERQRPLKRVHSSFIKQKHAFSKGIIKEVTDFHPVFHDL